MRDVSDVLWRVESHKTVNVVECPVVVDHEETAVHGPSS